jgi:hypothetical protein
VGAQSQRDWRGRHRSAPGSVDGRLDRDPSSNTLARTVGDLRAGRKVDAANLVALQRAVGNRAVSRAVLQRQPRTPVAAGTSTATKFLRIRVVGHASARWRSASTGRTADARNETLALERAEAVKKLIAAKLAEETLPVPVEFDVTTADDEHQAVTLGSHGEGSREALERSGGDRTQDEEYDRRVDVEAELVTTETGTRTVKLPPVRKSAKTKDWLVTITSFREVALGAAVVEVEMEIKNPITGRVATGSAVLGGGGVNIGKPWKSRAKPGKAAVGSRDRKFRSDSPIGFDDFDGRLIRMERAQAVIGVGRKALWLTFLGLSKTPMKIQGGWSFGKPALGGYVVSGRLHLDDVPSDFYLEDPGTATNPFKSKSGQGQSAEVRFKTGSATIRRTDAHRIGAFVETWVRRFK